jgi:hypothetical protein
MAIPSTVRSVVRWLTTPEPVVPCVTCKLDTGIVIQCPRCADPVHEDCWGPHLRLDCRVSLSRR